MPSAHLTEAIKEGRQAFLDGKPQAHNPYGPDDTRFLVWYQGWHEAAQDVRTRQAPDDVA